MAKTTKITLDGIEYEVPALNIGQMEDIAPVLNEGSSGVFKILRIAFKRATPTPNWDEVGINLDECRSAVEAILVMAGMEPKKATDPQQPPALALVAKE